MSDRIMITGLHVESFAGLRAVDLHPSQLTIIGGPNATGKTSVLRAIRAAMERGGISEDAIHIDAERAEVRVELSDGTVVRRTRRRGSQQRVEVERDGARYRGPQRLLADLLDPVALDPVEWLRGDRERAIMEALPLRITEDDLPSGVSEIFGTVGTDGHALAVIAEIDRQIMAARRAEKRAAKEIAAYISEEEERIQEVDDPADEIAAAAADLARAEDQATRWRAEIEAHDRARADVEMAERRIRDWDAKEARIVSQIAALQQQLEDIRATRDVDAEHLDALRARLADMGTPPDAPSEDDIGLARERLMRARERQAAYHAYLDRVAALDADRRKLSKMREGIDRMTETLAEVRALPARLLAEADLPIEGLEYRDGALTVRGVPLDQLSGAETIRIAARIAAHRVRQRRGQFVLLDGLEALDDEQRAALYDEIIESGVQWICTIVGDAGETPDGATVIYLGPREEGTDE